MEETTAPTPPKKPRAPRPKKPAAAAKPVPAPAGKAPMLLMGMSLVVAACAVGALVYVSQARPVPPSADPMLEQMRGRMEQMEQQMAAQAERAAAPSPEMAVQLEAQQRTIASLEEKLDAFSRQQEGTAHQAQMSAMVLALTAVQQKVAEGQPLEDEVMTLENLAMLVYGQQPAEHIMKPLLALKNVSARGTPSPVALQLAFDAMLTDVMRNHAQAQKNEGWRGWLRAMLSRFITLRSVDKRGEGVDATLTRAELALSAGNFKQVQAELETLPQNLEPITQAFRDLLGLRLAADDAVFSMHRVLQAELRATLSGVAAPAAQPATEAGE